MKIDIKKDGTAMTMILEGRLDTKTAPELRTVVEENIEGLTSLTFDLEKLAYLSSAGLRIFMSAQKIMLEQGEMKLLHVGEEIMDILEMVGLTDVFTIE